MARKHLRPVAGAAVLAASLAGCFSDTPQQPNDSPPMAPEFATTVQGNLTDLGTLGDEAVATGINNLGHISGYHSVDFSQIGFLWQSGVVTDMENYATGVSDAGHVVGGVPAFLWQSGTLTNLPMLTEECGSDAFSLANAVNSSGQAVGEGENVGCGQSPVLWENGTARDLGGLNGTCCDGVARGINANGQIVGESTTGFPLFNRHGFIWESGAMRDLGSLGGPNSAAYGINLDRQVVGQSDLTDGRRQHAFLWLNDQMFDLGTLGGPSSYARGINDDGVVVGYSMTASSTDQHPVYHAFVWQGDVMSDLGTLGGDDTRANAINNAGQIVGQSNTTKGGRSHAVRWTIPTTNFWSERKAISTRRVHAVGTAGGNVYVIGGRSGSGTVLSTVQFYHPSTNSWAARAPLPAPRHTGNGAATLSGTMYVAGGRDGFGGLSRTLFAFNSSGNRWTTKANMPVPSGCGGSAIISGKLYVFSGCTSSAGGAQVPAGLLHRYDPVANSWKTLHAAPAVHFRPVVGATGGKLYVAGGSNSAGVAINRLDVYDPASDTWSTRAAMPTARTAAAGAMSAGKLYVMGGSNGDATFYRSVVEVYDPVANAWSTKAPMIAERAEAGVGVVNNLLYAVGGRNVRTTLGLNESFTP
jgi:probable HAF family extracellular repeat protein